MHHYWVYVTFLLHCREVAARQGPGQLRIAVVFISLDELPLQLAYKLRHAVVSSMGSPQVATTQECPTFNTLM